MGMTASRMRINVVEGPRNTHRQFVQVAVSCIDTCVGVCMGFSNRTWLRASAAKCNNVCMPRYACVHVFLTSYVHTSSATLGYVAAVHVLTPRSNKCGLSAARASQEDTHSLNCRQTGGHRLAELLPSEHNWPTRTDRHWLNYDTAFKSVNVDLHEVVMRSATPHDWKKVSSPTSGYLVWMNLRISSRPMRITAALQFWKPHTVVSKPTSTFKGNQAVLRTYLSAAKLSSIQANNHQNTMHGMLQITTSGTFCWGSHIHTVTDKITATISGVPCWGGTFMAYTHSEYALRLLQMYARYVRVLIRVCDV